MAELADALASGASDRKVVEVQVLSSAFFSALKSPAQPACEDQTPDEWSLLGDQGHVFQPLRARMDAVPRIVEPQARWLQYLRQER